MIDSKIENMLVMLRRYDICAYCQYLINNIINLQNTKH